MFLALNLPSYPMRWVKLAPILRLGKCEKVRSQVCTQEANHRAQDLSTMYVAINKTGQGFFKCYSI